MSPRPYGHSSRINYNMYKRQRDAAERRNNIYFVWTCIFGTIIYILIGV